jgi:hypothetical protein
MLGVKIIVKKVKASKRYINLVSVLTLPFGELEGAGSKVYNVLGEKVADLTVSNKQTINLSSLPSATYVVLINYNGSLIKTERISIIH